MITICILILLAMIAGRPVMNLVGQLKDVNWTEKFTSLWCYIVKYGTKAGRIASKPLLQFYYVVTEGETTTLEKAMIYGCIIYILMPFSVLPRVVYHYLGILDEAAAAIYVYDKIKNKLTPEIEAKVQSTLDSWFGPEYVVVEETV
ncbi:MAG: DUF1232 domain-containing protein [Paludibacteraceae bacterium]|nr:DUF1232 domain-containing protein [Paludibacteraceae bacterium]